MATTTTLGLYGGPRDAQGAIAAKSANTAAPDTGNDRRRRYIGGVRNAVLFFLTVLGARL